MAKKKGKKASKSTGKNVTQIYYECQGSSCVASIHQANIGGAKSVVVLSAIGTDVDLDFRAHAGSPFKKRRGTISIKAGKSKHFEVDSPITHQHYAYDLTCGGCSGFRPPAPPEMIVP
jgi:hypothetical protein